MSGRPHLWKTTRTPLSSLPLDGVANPWADLPIVETTCTDDSCRLTAAQSAGALGDGPGICAGIVETRWREECFFRVGERSPDIARGVTVCLGAGPFIERCLGHISRSLATPPIALSDAVRWQTLNEKVASASAALPQPLAQRMADRMWAESLLASYSAAEQATGDPLDHLPDSARPHILAAAAWRLVQTQTHTGRDAWMTALDAALKRRGAAHQPEARPGKIPSDWATVLPGEEVLPWVAYLRDHRRVRGQSEEADRLICLLEATARSDTPDSVLIAEAMEHTDREVRWTAARVAPQKTRHARLSTSLLVDPDPLVVQRAQGSKTR